MSRNLVYPNEIYAYSATSVILSIDGVTWDGFYSEDMVKIARVEGSLRSVRGIQHGSVAYIRENETYKIDITFFRSSFRSGVLFDVISQQQGLSKGFFDPVNLTITDNSSGQSFNFKAVLDGWSDLTFSSTTSPITLSFLASNYQYQDIVATGRQRSTLDILSERVGNIIDGVGKTISSVFS